MGELNARVNGSTPKQAEVLRLTVKVELLTRIGELAHRGDSNDENQHQVMGEINQRLNDLEIVPNTHAHCGEPTSSYGATNNNHYGPGNNNRPNGQAQQYRKISN